MIKKISIVLIFLFTILPCFAVSGTYLMPQAEKEYDGERYEEALDIVNKVIQLSPNESSAYYLRAKIYHNMDDLDNAIIDLSRVIDLSPTMETYLYRGYLKAKTNRFVPNEISKDFYKSIEISLAQLASDYQPPKIPQKNQQTLGQVATTLANSTVDEIFQNIYKNSIAIHNESLRKYDYVRIYQKFNQNFRIYHDYILKLEQDPTISTETVVEIIRTEMEIGTFLNETKLLNYSNTDLAVYGSILKFINLVYSLNENDPILQNILKKYKVENRDLLLKKFIFRNEKEILVSDYIEALYIYASGNKDQAITILNGLEKSINDKSLLSDLKTTKNTIFKELKLFNKYKIPKYGIGIELEYAPNNLNKSPYAKNLIVTKVIPNSSAEIAGLKVGDIIDCNQLGENHKYKNPRDIMLESFGDRNSLLKIRLYVKNKSNPVDWIAQKIDSYLENKSNSGDWIPQSLYIRRNTEVHIEESYIKGKGRVAKYTYIVPNDEKYGVGIQYEKPLNSYPLIKKVFEGSSADKANIKEGMILSINNEDVKNLTREEFDNKISGEKNTIVVLTIDNGYYKKRYELKRSF